MKSLLLTLLLLLIAIGINQSQAFWQSRDSNYDKSISSGSSLTFTYGSSSTVANTPTLPFTFTNENIGTPSSTRYVTVCFSWNGAAGGSNGTISGVTIGGISATQAVNYYPAQRGNAIWYAAVPTGTTANVLFTAGGGNGFLNAITISVGNFTGSASPSVSSTLTTSPPAYASGQTTGVVGTVTVPSGGVAITCGYADTSTAGSSGWTNATKDVDISTPSGAQTGSEAHLTTTASVTETMTNVNGGFGFISASFHP